MSFKDPPSYVSSVFNPREFQALDEISVVDSVARVNGSSINQLLITPSGEIFDQIETRLASVESTADPVAGSLKRALDFYDRTSDPQDQNIPSAPDSVVAWYDFSVIDNVGFDVSGHSRHLTNNNGATVVSDTQRTRALKCLSKQYNSTTPPQASSSVPSVLRNDAMASTLRTESVAFSFWINPGPTKTGHQTAISKRRRRIGPSPCRCERCH